MFVFTHVPVYVLQGMTRAHTLHACFLCSISPFFMFAAPLPISDYPIHVVTTTYFHDDFLPAECRLVTLIWTICLCAQFGIYSGSGYAVSRKLLISCHVYSTLAATFTLLVLFSNTLQCSYHFTSPYNVYN